MVWRWDFQSSTSFVDPALHHSWAEKRYNGSLPPDKRKRTYLRLFSQIKKWIKPDQVHQGFCFLSDFERGAYLAVSEIFPGVRSEGCFFHLSKRVDVHVKQLGLLRKYADDFDFKIRVKKLAALAFVPLQDLITCFTTLAATFEDDELPLLQYFENTWIGALVGRRRLKPVFPHEMWHVLWRHFRGSTRTTNSLESFHNAFNSLLSCQHPTIPTLYS